MKLLIVALIRNEAADLSFLGVSLASEDVGYSRLTTLTTYMYVDLVLTYILTDVDMVRADILGWSVCMYVPSNKMNKLS